MYVCFYAAELCPPQDGYGQIMSLNRLVYKLPDPTLQYPYYVMPI